jgi:hypothetical protein
VTGTFIGRKRECLLSGATIVIADGVFGGSALRGRAHKPLEVQTSKVNRQQIVQRVSAAGKTHPKAQRHMLGPAHRLGMLSAEDPAELAAWYGELIRGLQRLLNALRPEARSLKPVVFVPESQASPHYS